MKKDALDSDSESESGEEGDEESNTDKEENENNEATHLMFWPHLESSDLK